MVILFNNYVASRCYSQKSENGITAASYVLQKDEDYIRVECICENGTKAWTNPIFFNK